MNHDICKLEENSWISKHKIGKFAYYICKDFMKTQVFVSKTLKQTVFHRTLCIFFSNKNLHTFAKICTCMITLHPDVNLEVSRFWPDRRLYDPIIRNNEPVLPRGGGSPDVGVLDHQGAKIGLRVGRTIRLHHCKLHRGIIPLLLVGDN